MEKMTKRVTLPAKSNLTSVYVRKQLTPLPKPMVLAHALIVSDSAHTCSYCLANDSIDPAGRAKAFIWRKMCLAKDPTITKG